MATGYTYDVAQGKVADLPTFVRSCARAFGALISLRDYPQAPIPEAIPADTSYHDARLAEAGQRLADLAAMGDEEFADELRAEYEEACARFETRRAERAIQRDRYESMLAKVRAWAPPTPEHEGLKRFMLDQLTQSVEQDCSEAYDTEPQLRDPVTARDEEIRSAERDVVYHTDHRAQAIARAQGATAWIVALQQSLAAHEEAAPPSA